jgi:6-carboxyhexanoate--CoA ligase
MRAAIGGEHEAGGRHVSGAERLVPPDDVDAAVLELTRRARGRRPEPDFVRVTLERVAIAARVAPLPLVMTGVPDPEEARRLAEGIVVRCGVAPPVIAAAFELLQHGAGEGGALRGAALVHAVSGRRLEPDPSRGVRASHLDYAPGAREAAREVLAAAGLAHFRTLEALAVASKVAWAGVRAELCWSDDPGYEAGYVATPEDGYVRLPVFKPEGAAGGRVFFVAEGTDVPLLLQRLEREAVLIEGPVLVSTVRGPLSGT